MMKNKQEIIDSCAIISNEIRTLRKLVRTEKLDYLETCLECINDILSDFHTTKEQRIKNLNDYFNGNN